MDNQGVVGGERERGDVDGEELIDALDIDEAEIERRKSFVRLTEADRERLRELETTFEDVADDVVEECHDHLTSDADAAEALGRSNEGLDRLKADQRQYLRSLADAEYDRESFARRARVGKEMLDMGPKFYLGGYSVYYERLIDAIGENAKAEYGSAAGSGNEGGERTDDGGKRTAADTFDGRNPSDKDVGRAERSQPGRRGLLAGLLRRSTAESGETDTSTAGDTTDADVEAAIDAVVAQTTSLLKVLALDQQIAMDTHVHGYSEAARREAEHREQVAREVERDLQGPIDDVSSSSSVVAERSAAIRDIADEQARDMEDVAAEISQMSATVEEIAATADEVEETSDEAASRARSGEEAADEAIDVMEEVADAAIQASADLERLQSQIDEIDAVIEAIDEIAEQTNLLALNASIEAARAGEAGDGFAVVADEVKQLAEESRARASDVEETVDRVQADAADTIESLSETTDKLHEGIDRGEDAMDSLDEIVDAVERTTEGIAEVAVATDEQAVSAEEVTAMVEKTRDRADEVAERVDDVAEASSEQTQQMERIRRAADRLADLDADGSPSSTDSSPSSGDATGSTPSTTGGRSTEAVSSGEGRPEDDRNDPSASTETTPEATAEDEFAFVGTDGGVSSKEPTARSDDQSR